MIRTSASYWSGLTEMMSTEFNDLSQPIKYIDKLPTNIKKVSEDEKWKREWVEYALTNFPYSSFTEIADTIHTYAKAALDSLLLDLGIDINDISYTLWYRSIPDEVVYDTIFDLIGGSSEHNVLFDLIDSMYKDLELSDKDLSKQYVLETLLLTDNEEANENITNSYEQYLDDVRELYKETDEYIADLINWAEDEEYDK